MPRKDIDETDKKILSIISKNNEISYSKLASRVGVSRNTVYRRVKNLRNLGLIKQNFLENTSINVLEFGKIGISTLVLGLNFDATEIDEASCFLEDREEVKLLLETYGKYDFIAMLFCEKGKERECISRLREDLDQEQINLDGYEVFSANLEKIDLTLPF